jgi:hypothetical protein
MSEAQESIEAVCRASALVIDWGLDDGWLFRGCIEVGEFARIADYSSFVGRALASAYETEHRQEWCGCAVSPSIERRFPEITAALCETGHLVRYPIPLKAHDKGGDPDIALNWCLYDMSQRKRTKSPKRLESLKKLAATAPDERSLLKIQNAIDFVKEMRSRGRESSEHFAIQVMPLGR